MRWSAAVVASVVQPPKLWPDMPTDADAPVTPNSPARSPSSVVVESSTRWRPVASVYSAVSSGAPIPIAQPKTSGVVVPTWFGAATT
jgi:hypothetical protein